MENTLNIFNKMDCYELNETIKMIEKMAIETPELEVFKDIAIKDSIKYNFGVPWWFLDDQERINNGEDIFNLSFSPKNNLEENDKIINDIENKINNTKDIFNIKLPEKKINIIKLETILEENDNNKNEEKWINIKKPIKKVSKKKTKIITHQTFIPRLICKTDYDSNIIKKIFDNSVGKEVFFSSKKENNLTIINLNLKGNYTIGTDGFNLIQGILYSHKNNNKFKLTYNKYTIYLNFDESVNISKMNYYLNPTQGIKYNKIRNILS